MSPRLRLFPSTVSDFLKLPEVESVLTGQGSEPFIRRAIPSIRFQLKKVFPFHPPFRGSPEPPTLRQYEQLVQSLLPIFHTQNALRDAILKVLEEGIFALSKQADVFCRELPDSMTPVPEYCNGRPLPYNGSERDTKRFAKGVFLRGIMLPELPRWLRWSLKIHRWPTIRELWDWCLMGLFVPIIRTRRLF
ncbi:hypothetical protein COY07_05230 [Candidatus Peregrinibacteria bacterium CG_4_10_14_0_2_um_filter_43_11]|nr:MAG: hypothetical protein COY07_05230 [Candidatus Peregrinibacteria bacterium CG_4_10_14_0_2_um_filter_43_11]